MSDNEEPAAKLLKMQRHDLDDELGEGQEEWLSEGNLTDDDYQPSVDHENSDHVSMSNDDMLGAPDSEENSNTYHDTGDSNAQDGHEGDPEENIEETLNNFENSQEFPGELSNFLIRKTDTRLSFRDSPMGRETEIDDNTKLTEDDGHDTDDLLRMLGEDGARIKKKHGIKIVKAEHKVETTDEEDDDDEYIFEGAKVTRLKMAKNAIIKKYPTKAVPEEMSDKEEESGVVYIRQSSDEVATMKNMFGVTRRPGNVASKSTTIGGINALRTVTKRVVSLDDRSEKQVQQTPYRQVVLKRVPKEDVPIAMRQPELRYKPEPDEIINEEEFLDEEEFDLDEVLDSEDNMDDSSSRHRYRQRIMRPERMDEEVPTDGDSQSDDESLYDGMPSSESEDLDEWFTLDIRAEKAGDYLPILGTRAKKLLSTEKQRVGARLATLKNSLSALTESGRQQTEQLRRATSTLAELDAALKAT